MTTRNPSRAESNGDHWAPRAGRPSRSHPAFKDVSDDALAVAQEWYDQAETEHAARVKRQEALAAWAESDEGQRARDEMRARMWG